MYFPHFCHNIPNHTVRLEVPKYSTVSTLLTATFDLQNCLAGLCMVVRAWGLRHRMPRLLWREDCIRASTQRNPFTNVTFSQWTEWKKAHTLTAIQSMYLCHLLLNHFELQGSSFRWVMMHFKLFLSTQTFLQLQYVSIFSGYQK